MKNKSARGRNDSCKSPETAIKKIKSRASKRVVSDKLCMIEERKRERERERERKRERLLYIYYLLIF